MFQFSFIYNLAELFAIESFSQLLYRMGIDADDILRFCILIVAQLDSEVFICDIDDDAGSDE